MPARDTIPLTYSKPTHASVTEDHDLAAMSVLCGLMPLTGVLSLLFGVVVLRRARRLRPLELALAIVGTTLGTLNVAVTALFVLVTLG